MKKLITLFALLMCVAATAQGVRTLEIEKVDEQPSVNSETRLMVWDSTNFGKVKYKKLGDLPIGNDGVVQSVSLLGNLLNFSGTNGAFSGAVDLSSLGGGASNLDDLLDVSNGTPTSQYFLRGNGTSWEAYPITFADIDFGTPNTVQYLRKDGTWFSPTFQNILDNGNTVDGTTINSINNSSSFFWQNSIGSSNFSFINYNGVGVSDTTNGNGIVLNSDLIRYDYNGSSVSVTASNITSSWDQKLPNGNGTYSIGLTDGTTTALAGTNGIIDASTLDFGGSGSSTAAATTYDNTDSSLTSTNVKTALDELDAKIPSTKLTHRSFETDSIASLPLADIKASKLIYANVDRPNETPADTLYFTYPDLTVETIDADETWAPAFGSENGQVISLIPAPGSAMNKKISTKVGVKGIHALIYKGGVNFVESLSSSEWTFEDYTPPVILTPPVLETVSHTEIATDATSVVATAPTGIQDDDILLMVVSLDDDGNANSVTSSGFTLIEDYNLSGSHRQVLLWKRASSESGNYTVNLTDAQDGSVSIARISGANTSGSPIDVEGVGNDVFASTITPNDITSTEANTLAISFITVDRNYRVSGSSTVSGSGWSLISLPASYGADGIGFMWAEKDVPTAGSVGQPTFTFDSSDQAIGQTINIKS